MKRKYQKTLELIYARPVSANIRWSDIEALFVELGAEITEREGSRVGVRLFNERRVFHRPHPSPNVDKGAIASRLLKYVMSAVKTRQKMAKKRS